MSTRLEVYLKSRGIKPAHLARESGYSRQHLLRIRMGRMEPTRRCIAAIVAACRRLARDFEIGGEGVAMNDRFDRPRHGGILPAVRRDTPDEGAEAQKPRAITPAAGRQVGRQFRRAKAPGSE